MFDFPDGVLVARNDLIPCKVLLVRGRGPSDLEMVLKSTVFSFLKKYIITLINMVINENFTVESQDLDLLKIILGHCLG